MNLRPFRHISKKSENDDQASLRELIRAYRRRLRLFPLLRKLLRSWASTPPLSSHSSSVSSSDAELGKWARPPDPAHVTPFIDAQPSENTLLRSNSETSKRSSLATTTTTSGCRRLEPLRRCFALNTDLLARVPFETDSETDLEFDYGSTSQVYDKEYFTPPPPLTPSTPTHTDLEQSGTDLFDMRIMDSPISLQAGESPIVGEFEDQIPAPSPGRYRLPTYGTLFSQHSIMTLPVYSEQEDDRESVHSQAPTYRSYRSTRVPRISLRSGRPPLPVPPLPVPPTPTLFVFPSSHYLTK